MQKEYTITEIKEVCANAKLTITNISTTAVSAINTRNGMQHIFKVKQLNAEEELKKAPNTKLLKEVKVNEVIEEREDIKAQKEMEKIAQDEKERILQSFNELHKKTKFKDKSTMSVAYEDEYVLPTDPVRTVEVEAVEEDSLFIPPEETIEEIVDTLTSNVVVKKKIKPAIVKEEKVKKKRGRKPGTKVDKKTGKTILPEE